MEKQTDMRLVTQRGISPTNKAGRESSSRERFPSFEDTHPNLSLPPVFESPRDSSPQSAGISPARWTAKQASFEQTPWRTSHHKPRRSVSEAIHRIRTRDGSVSENAHELAVALKAPVSWKLIGLSVIWYNTSAATNTSSKTILNAYPKPVTLTLIQFASVSIWCLAFACLASLFPTMKRTIPALKNGLRYPTLEVISTALPLSVFQLLGHLLSSYATSKIPVSLVHTIKGLSPLFTVLAYRLFLRIRYARATYLSLVPLTVGVMMACSADFSTNFLGISASLLAAIVFVTQNIFSKKLFTEASRAEDEGRIAHSRKLDKLNLLCYCSVGAFLFTTPVWIFTEGVEIMRDVWHDGSIDLSARGDAVDHGPLVMEYIFNGAFHFAQNILAFILLSRLSPVSYSVASLIKRVWVIGTAMLWFRSHTTNVQVVGIGLTFLGLYLYDRTSMEDAAERRTKSDHFRHAGTLLPLVEKPETDQPNGDINLREGGLQNSTFHFPGTQFQKDDREPPPSDSNHVNTWLPPGTKQESTWEARDAQIMQGRDGVQQ